MSMKEIIKKLDAAISAGLEFSTPGETERVRRELYCAENSVDYCCNCSLVNYGRDCKNNPVEDNVNSATMRISTR